MPDKINDINRIAYEIRSHSLIIHINHSHQAHTTSSLVRCMQINRHNRLAGYLRWRLHNVSVVGWCLVAAALAAVPCCYCHVCAVCECVGRVVNLYRFTTIIMYFFDCGWNAIRIIIPIHRCGAQCPSMCVCVCECALIETKLKRPNGNYVKNVNFFISRNFFVFFRIFRRSIGSVSSPLSIAISLIYIIDFVVCVCSLCHAFGQSDTFATTIDGRDMRAPSRRVSVNWWFFFLFFAAFSHSSGNFSSEHTHTRTDTQHVLTIFTIFGKMIM